MALPPPTPDAPAGADPSMEEILASIRRILNEDDPGPQADAPAEDEVLVLDRSMMVGLPDAEAAEIAPVAPVIAQEVATPPPDAFSAPTETADLVAPAAAAAAASSLGSLARTLAAGRPTQVWAGGPTLEDIVRSELRPLLKDWLDSNLPPMVERLVRAEIDRVAGRPVP